MNTALLAKLGWRLLVDQDSLWARILRSKYNAGDIRDPSWLIVKGTWSSTWRSVCIGVRQGVLPGIRWIIGDGTQVRFWHDRWLGNTPLCDLAHTIPHAQLQEARVCDLWWNTGGWDMQRLALYLPEACRLHMTSLVIDTVTGSKDRLSWGPSPDGTFTVKSAYKLLTHDQISRQQMGAFYDRIWHVIVPERIRLFLWLTSHKVLMTNAERKRRHLSQTDICGVCKAGEETILHILRDCPAISGVWTRLIPSEQHDAFFNMSLMEWLYVNLGVSQERYGSPWATLFAIVIWWSWKWRCESVFGVQRQCRNRILFLKEQAIVVNRAHNNARSETQSPNREERWISWKRPSEGWFKINTDGASRGNPGLATAGGVIRDFTGRWCQGFALNIGFCSAPMAELWGVYYGLCIAWDRGITQVELEVDSQLVVGFLKDGVGDCHPLSFLVRLCYGLLSKDWLVRISHVYREANRLADGLANYAFSLPLGLHFLSEIPECVSYVLEDDGNGVASSRMVLV